MLSDTMSSPLRLQILPGVVAVCDGHLVEIEDAPCDGSVRVRDLASNRLLEVRVGTLRGRPALSDAELNKRLERAHDSGDAAWNQAVADGQLPDRLRSIRARIHDAVRQSPTSREGGGDSQAGYVVTIPQGARR